MNNVTNKNQLVPTGIDDRKLTDSVARNMLSAQGIDTVSSGGCTDRYNIVTNNILISINQRTVPEDLLHFLDFVISSPPTDYAY